MYWDLGLLPGMPQKWKVSPLGKAAFVQKAGFTLLFWSACFWWYLKHFSGGELFLFFQYVYSTDFCRELNLQIDCIFVMFDIKMISNVAQATFCKVFLLYTNYAILYILYSIHQQTTISSIYPYCSITYYTQYLVFNHSFKPQYIVLPWTVVPIRVLPAQAHARARTRFRVFLKIL